MGKFTKYFVIMSGLLLLFYFSGNLPPETANAAFLKLLLNPSDFQTSSWVAKAILAIEGIAAVAIVIGSVIGGRLELAVVSGMTIFAFNIGWDFLYVLIVVAGVNPVLSILLFSPIALMFAPTIIEWWRGIGV